MKSNDLHVPTMIDPLRAALQDAGRHDGTHTCSSEKVHRHLRALALAADTARPGLDETGPVIATGPFHSVPDRKPGLWVVFDGPPSHESGRFVEVEDETYASQCAGTWRREGDDYWALGPFALAADPARPGLDVEVLARVICASQERCDGTCPDFEGADAIHRHDAEAFAAEYDAIIAARLTEDRSMTTPQTDAGKALLVALHDHSPSFLGGSGPSESRYVARIEAESRNATLDEVLRAVEGLIVEAGGDEPREHECIQCGATFIVQCPEAVTTPEGWRWECPSCDGPVTVMGMCETCGVFGVMRLTEDRP